MILAHNRQELLNMTIAAIRPQVDTLMVIDNASEPRLTVPEGVGTMFIPEQPPNLAKFWNMGLDFFVDWYKRYDMTYDVAILCDDAVVPEGWFSAVVQGMRECVAVAGSSSPWGHPFPPMSKYGWDEDIAHRMCSWAFIVDGSCPVRADESMRWWWFDTDFDLQLRAAGGTVLIGTHPVANQQPNYYTNIKPELGAQTGADREVFVAKYGRTPW